MELKFYFFPTAFPDETLHSILSRYARLSGLGTCSSVFDSDQAEGSFSHNVFFPCRLADLVNALPPGTSLSVPQLIERHTLLPYYQPFLTAHHLANAQSQMADRGGQALKLRLGLIASRLELESRVRYCPACVVQDTACGGVAYWHRVHQLPGVMICPHHMTPLTILDHRWLSKSSRRLQLPIDDEVQLHAVPLEVCTEHRGRLLEIAQLSLQVFQANAPPQSAHRIRSEYLRGVIALNLASNSGRLKLAGLARYMSAFFQTLPASSEFSILGSSPDGIPAAWVTKILRKPRLTHHPLKFILLASALGIDMSRLLQRDEHVITASLREAERNKATLRTAGVSPGYVSSALSALGTCLTEDANLIEQAVWSRALQGADAKDIASGLGVSAAASVYRIIRAAPEGPARWKQSRYKRALVGRRERFEAQYRVCLAQECADYIWLYRNDQQWLAEHIQELGAAHKRNRKNNRPFSELDHILAAKVLECARSLQALPSKPVRISRARIGRELNALSRFEKQLSRLPLCAAALASMCESLDEFHNRRLYWATQELMREGKPITEWLLYRTACIRCA